VTACSRHYGAVMSRNQRPPMTTINPSGAELEELARQYPEEREELLLEAASAWSAAGEHERALVLYDRLLAEGCESPRLVEAFRVGALWDAGRVDEAREAARQFRARHPKDAGAWNMVAETFEVNGEPREAAVWFTAGLTHVLGAGAPLTVEMVEGAADRHGAEMLVIGRHRVRRLLEEPHDECDDLAHALHDGRTSAFPGSLPLDEAHDPERLRAREDGDPDPEVVRAELERLSGEMASASDRQPGHAALFWPEKEFAELLGHWPAMAEDSGADHAGHARGVERTLRGLADGGARQLAVVHGTVDDLRRSRRVRAGRRRLTACAPRTRAPRVRR
jgi:hypothetical protein